MVNYYKILGISRKAGADTIKKACKKLAMRYHPDRQPTATQHADQKIKQINEVYGILSNVKKRKSYDRKVTKASETR